MSEWGDSDLQCSIDWSWWASTRGRQEAKKQTHERGGVSFVYIWGKSLPSKRMSRCKGRETEQCLEGSGQDGELGLEVREVILGWGGEGESA